MGAAKRIKRCTTYGRKPRSAVAALRQARQFLVDEGKDRWCKGTVFTPNKRSGESVIKDPDAALCGNWGVCAIGAVELVADDLPLVPYDRNGKVEGFEVDGGKNPVIPQAIRLLDEATNGCIWSYNDQPSRKRADVIRAFDKAIALAEGKA